MYCPTVKAGSSSHRKVAFSCRKGVFLPHIKRRKERHYGGNFLKAGAEYSLGGGNDKQFGAASRMRSQRRLALMPVWIVRAVVPAVWNSISVAVAVWMVAVPVGLSMSNAAGAFLPMVVRRMCVDRSGMHIYRVGLYINRLWLHVDRVRVHIDRCRINRGGIYINARYSDAYMDIDTGARHRRCSSHHDNAGRQTCRCKKLFHSDFLFITLPFTKLACGHKCSGQRSLPNVSVFSLLRKSPMGLTKDKRPNARFIKTMKA